MMRNGSTQDSFASIQFAAADTSLGSVLVAGTERGLCWIELGDSREILETSLRDRFPKAERASDVEEHLQKVMSLIEAPGDKLDVPLDVRGTAFQREVWDCLQTIPIGSTATYAEVARRIGRPSAVRAVARACASNELALAIPCHRVIRSDGGLGGYRWGMDRKLALLAAERQVAV